MSRKKKEQKPQPEGQNIDEEQLQALFFQSKRDYERALGTKKKADADFKNCCRRIKAELGKRGIAEIKLAITLDTDEGEADVKAEIESRLRVMKWMGVPVGTQADLFPDNDPTPITDRAFAEGRRHALAGEPRANPHHHTTEAARTYNAGYEKGQDEKLTAGIKPLEDTPSGPVPRDEWQKQMADENAAVSEAIKSGKVAELGSSRPSFEVQ